MQQQRSLFRCCSQYNFRQAECQHVLIIKITDECNKISYMQWMHYKKRSKYL